MDWCAVCTMCAPCVNVYLPQPFQLSSCIAHISMVTLLWYSIQFKSHTLAYNAHFVHKLCACMCHVFCSAMYCICWTSEWNGPELSWNGMDSILCSHMNLSIKDSNSLSWMYRSWQSNSLRILPMRELAVYLQWKPG